MFFSNKCGVAGKRKNGEVVRGKGNEERDWE
jgi:hypothetical protein